MGSIGTPAPRRSFEASLEPLPAAWRPYLVPAALLAMAGALGASTAGTPSGGLEVAAGAVLTVFTCVAVYWDVRERRIPNTWTYTGVAAGLALGALGGWAALLLALAGFALGGGLLLVLAIASRGGLGMGDIKLGGALGALVGPEGALEVVVVSALVGGVLGLAWLLAGQSRKDAVPYAPALALGGWVALLMAGPVVA